MIPPGTCRGQQVSFLTEKSKEKKKAQSRERQRLSGIKRSDTQNMASESRTFLP